MKYFADGIMFDMKFTSEVEPMLLPDLEQHAERTTKFCWTEAAMKKFIDSYKRYKVRAKTL